MMTKVIRFLGSSLLFVSLGSAALAAPERDCPVPPPKTEARYELAVSLKRLQEELYACQRRGSCSQEVLQLYGLKRIEGYAIDPANRDIILFGGTQPDWPALHIDDLVVALRNATKRYVFRRGNTLYYSHPGVSIDPDGRVMAKLDRIMASLDEHSSEEEIDEAIEQWCEECPKPQSVRVLGIPSHNHMARIMVSADYFMKRVADSSVKLDLPGFESYSDLTLKHAVHRAFNNNGSPLGIAGMNRYWFYSGENTYVEENRGVVIKRSDVILLDEAEHLTKNGQMVAAGYVDPFARKFSCTFSQRYQEIADLEPIYRELENVFRWVALARILVDKQAFDKAKFNARFLLDGFKVRPVHVERQVEGIATVNKYDHPNFQIRLPSCGGVEVRLTAENMVFVHDPTGRYRRVMRAALSSRPSIRSVYWVIRLG